MDLRKVDLRQSNLTKAVLTEATLLRIDCYAAVFDGANLEKAILFEAKLGNTTFIEANLSEAEFGSA